MFAKRTIKRLEDSSFHTKRNSHEVWGQFNTLPYAITPCEDDTPEQIATYHEVRELRESVADEGYYFDERYKRINKELARLKYLPWYRKIFMA